METTAAARVLPLTRRLPTVLGVGSFLKNTVCLIHGAEARMSRINGGLDTLEGVQAFEAAVAALVDGAGGAGTLEAVAHDLHPDFPNTRFALGLGVEAIAVQHHHAHVTAVMAERGLGGPVLGVALDGFGLGSDGGSWGGELLAVGPAGFRRLGHLHPLLQPGGDAAARQPWRMAAAALHALGRDAEITARFAGQPGADTVTRMLATGTQCRPTSSAGRLFDAACGLLGVRPVASFEGEAPIALEALVSTPRVLDAGWWIDAAGVLDLRPLLGHLPGLEPADGADLFHGTLIAALADWVLWGAEAVGLGEVVLCGGCFFNKVVSGGLSVALRDAGLRVHVAGALGPGDSAVSLGQAWAAAVRREG